MQKGLKLDGTTRAVATAIGAAIVTSVISMFLPVGLFEAITGSTGISELVPATAAPLGDTARALIAFTLGLIAFVITVALMLRKPAPAKATPTVKTVVENDEAAPVESEGPSFFQSMKAKLADFAASRRSGVVVTELSDLPKLRSGDAHPDAPPRRPISAERDFAGISPPPPLVLPEAPPAPETSATLPMDVDTVSILVDRLEVAVASREAQLAKLESLAKEQTSTPAPTQMVPERVEAEIVTDPSPRLEAVPDSPVKAKDGDEMDAALRSALETLHRMNGRTR